MDEPVKFSFHAGPTSAFVVTFFALVLTAAYPAGIVHEAVIEVPEGLDVNVSPVGLGGVASTTHDVPFQSEPVTHTVGVTHLPSVQIDPVAQDAEAIQVDVLSLDPAFLKYKILSPYLSSAAVPVYEGLYERLYEYVRPAAGM